MGSASANAGATGSGSATGAGAGAGAGTGCTATGAGSEEPNANASNEDNEVEEARSGYPVVVHFALRPLKLTIYREPKYQRLYKQLTKLHYLLMNKRRITRSDRAQLQELCKRLEQYHSERCAFGLQLYPNLYCCYIQYTRTALVPVRDMYVHGPCLGPRNARWQWS